MPKISKQQLIKGLFKRTHKTLKRKSMSLKIMRSLEIRSIPLAAEYVEVDKEIRINPNSELKTIARSLLHEFEHAKQNNQMYHELLETISYDEHPMEVEANLVEKNWNLLLHKTNISQQDLK